MEIIENKVLLITTDNPEQITDNIKRSAITGESQVAVKWGFLEAEGLAELGYEHTPSPILKDYKWTGKLAPFSHQEVTSSFLTIRKKAFCFNEQGTGKTASVIWAADYLMKLGKIKRVLVVCPLSIMKSAWQQDLFKFAMHRSVSVAYGDAKQRAKIIKDGSEFVIINFDGLAIVKEQILAGGFDLIVVDEANAYKNAMTNRWKVMKDVSEKVPYLWMLTGTPAAQSPLDAYGLAKLVNPKNTPRTFGQFRDKLMYKISQFKWVPRPTSQALVHSVLQPAIRFEKDQCVDRHSLSAIAAAFHSDADVVGKLRVGLKSHGHVVLRGVPQRLQ